MLIKLIKEVPDEIFNGCLSELDKVSWHNIFDNRKRGVFKTSTSIHLRSHDTSDYTQKPSTVEEFSAIVACSDNSNAVSKFPKHYEAALWIKEQVGGLDLGRIMIVHLEPKGEIGIHIDPGAYFKKHARYHIPLITNPDVQFFDHEGNRAHMPIKTLCRLNNLSNHGLINDSDKERIHLIVDVSLAEGNSIF